jgi:hypothetical protein
VFMLRTEGVGGEVILEVQLEGYSGELGGLCPSQADVGQGLAEQQVVAAQVALGHLALGDGAHSALSQGDAELPGPVRDGSLPALWVCLGHTPTPTPR